MARAKKNIATERNRGKNHFAMPLTTANFLILGFGILLIIFGFVLMGSVDNPDAFVSKTLAPIILVLSYAVVIPFGILYRKKK